MASSIWTLQGEPRSGPPAISMQGQTVKTRREEHLKTHTDNDHPNDSIFLARLCRSLFLLVAFCIVLPDSPSSSPGSVSGAASGSFHPSIKHQAKASRAMAQGLMVRMLRAQSTPRCRRRSPSSTQRHKRL